MAVGAGAWEPSLLTPVTLELMAAENRWMGWSLERISDGTLSGPKGFFSSESAVQL